MLPAKITYVMQRSLSVSRFGGLCEDAARPPHSCMGKVRSELGAGSSTETGQVHAWSYRRSVQLFAITSSSLSFEHAARDPHGYALCNTSPSARAALCQARSGDVHVSSEFCLSGALGYVSLQCKERAGMQIEP